MSNDIGHELEACLLKDLRKIVLEYVYLPILDDQETLTVLKSLHSAPDEREVMTYRLSEKDEFIYAHCTQEEELYDKILLNNSGSTYLLFKHSRMWYSKIYEIFVFWTQSANYVCFDIVRSVSNSDQTINIELHIHTDLDVLLRYAGVKDAFYATDSKLANRYN